MWFLLTRRLRRYVIMSVAVPIVVAVTRGLSRKLESRAGHPTRVSRGLDQASRIAGRGKRGGRRSGRR